MTKRGCLYSTFFAVAVALLLHHSAVVGAAAPWHSNVGRALGAGSRSERGLQVQEVRGILNSSSCKFDADCPNDGTCRMFNATHGTCRCAKSYASRHGGICNYRLKSQPTTFLLSLLLGFTGADWFFLARGCAPYIVAGVFKLLCVAVMLIGGAVSSEKIDSKATACCMCFILNVSAFAGVIWWLVDWIRALLGAFHDGNGMPLADW